MGDRESTRQDASDGCSADAPVPTDCENSSGDGDGWCRSPQLATDFEDVSCNDRVSDGVGAVGIYAKILNFEYDLTFGIPSSDIRISLHQSRRYRM